MKVRTSGLRGLAFVALGALTFAACDEKEPTTPVVPPAIVVTVTPQTATLTVGQTLPVGVSVANATNSAVNWSTSNAQIANVSNTGVITAVAPGTALITAASAQDTSKKGFVSVTVTPALQPTITLQPPSATIGLNQTLPLVAQVTGTTNTAVRFRSANAAVARVDSLTGVVTGVSIGGPIVITAIAQADTTRRATSLITVQQQVSGVQISITPTSASIRQNDSIPFGAVVTGAANTAVTWRTNNPAVATVSATGLVRGVSPGQAVITAIAQADTTVRAQANVVVAAPAPAPSISIASVVNNQTGQPVNPLAIAGQIDATVNVSAVPENDVRAVVVLVDNIEICRQNFTQPLGTTQGVATINCPINTASADSLGVARFLNGPHRISATALSGTGAEITRADFCPLGQPAPGQFCTVTFMNANVLNVFLTPTGPSAPDQVGRIWWRSFTVTATPTIFTPGDASQILTVQAFTSAGGLINTQTVNPTPGSGPVTVTFSQAALAGVEDSVFIQAQTTTSQSFVINNILGNPNVFSNQGLWLRIDNLAPRVNAITLPENAYINDAFTFNLCTVAANTTDLGVDRQCEPGRIRFDIVPANTPTAAPVAGGADVTNASGVAESPTNQEYALRITISDALGNQRIVYAGTGGTIVAAASVTAANVRRFGVDRTPPLVQTTGGPQHMSTNTGVNVWTLTYVDTAMAPAGPSGFGVDPLRARLIRYNAVAPNGVCLNPNTGAVILSGGNPVAITSASCFVIVTGNPGVVFIPAVDGYYQMSAFSVDAAGNQSPMLHITTLNDFTSPFAGSLTVPTSITGGASANLFAQLTDNVDLGQVWATIGFSGAGDPAWLVQAQQMIGDYGTPTSMGTPDNVLNVSDNRTITITQFIRSITQTTAGGAPTATSTFATVAEYAVRDVAGVQLGDVCPVPTAGDDAASQNCRIRHASIAAAVTIGVTPTNPYRVWTNFAAGQLLTATSAFTLGTVPSNMCNGSPAGPGTPQPCPSGDPSQASLTASVTGPAQTFNNPFQRVQFYVRLAGATNRAHLVGVGSTSVTDNTITGIRTWTYSTNFSAVGRAAGTYEVFALGVDANGDALMTQVGTIVVGDD